MARKKTSPAGTGPVMAEVDPYRDIENSLSQGDMSGARALPPPPETPSVPQVQPKPRGLFWFGLALLGVSVAYTAGQWRLSAIRVEIGIAEQRALAANREIEALRGEIAGLKTSVSAIPAPVASSISDAEVASVKGDLANLVSEHQRLSGELAALRTSLAALPEGSMSDAALATLSDQIAALDGRVQALEEAASAQPNPAIVSVPPPSDDEVLNALQKDLSLAQASGTGLAMALDAIAPHLPEGADVDALKALAIEPVTIEMLQQDFPALARAAIAASRVAGDDAAEEGSSFTEFLKLQLGMRSTEPVEGNDADAVLSRAEQHLAKGALTDALAEMDALPASALPTFADWLARARLYLAAETEIAALAAARGD